MGLEIVVGSLVIMIGFILFAIERLRTEQLRHQEELEKQVKRLDNLIESLKKEKDLEKWEL